MVFLKSRASIVTRLVTIEAVDTIVNAEKSSDEDGVELEDAEAQWVNEGSEDSYFTILSDGTGD